MTSRSQSGLIQQFLFGLPLRKAILTSSGIAILLLLGISVLGLRQYLLYRHCEQVVTASRHLLFQFSTIKEHVNEALITRQNLQFKEINSEIEALENDIEHILSDILIPRELKQGFITSADLVGLVFKLRSVQQNTETPAPEQLTAATAALRSIDGRITGVHQGLVSYTQGLLLGLHKTLAGSLALVLSVISILLFLVNHIVQTQKKPFSSESDTPLPPDTPPLRAMSRLYRFAALGHLSAGLAHELTNLVNGVINYTQALLDLNDERHQGSESQKLLTNLLSEEKKISHLIVELQQLARGNCEEAQPCPVKKILKPVETIIKGQARAEGIELEVDVASGLPLIHKNGQDLQVVLLSLIQNARSRVLQKYPSGKQEQKKIKISALLDQKTPQPKILIFISDHGDAKLSPPSNQNNLSLTAEPWLELEQCRLYLQHLGGDLIIENTPDQINICTCIIPCS